MSEVQGGLGSVGTYDAKLSGGVATVSVSVKYDMCAELQKISDAATNQVEKEALDVVIGILKVMP